MEASFFKMAAKLYIFGRKNLGGRWGDGNVVRTQLTGHSQACESLTIALPARTI